LELLDRLRNMLWSGMQGSTILGCVIGNNSFVGEGCTLEQTLVLGNDYYTNDKTRAASLEKGESALGIGKHFSCTPGQLQ